jgi:hypothetical protein
MDAACSTVIQVKLKRLQADFYFLIDINKKIVNK